VTVGRLQDAFVQAEEEGRAALIVYLCAGDPDLATTSRLITACAESGADMVEVGMPFSDPTADGEAIQLASQRALRKGVTLAAVLAAVREARKTTSVPILLFGYYNPILRYGEARLARDAKDAGVDGLLVVDLPPEEAGVLRGPAVSVGLDFVPLVAPTSNEDRIDAAASVATAFIYYVSLTGVTGSKAPDLARAALRAREVAARTGWPVAVGFGVKTADDVAVLAGHADGVVVGSALVRAIGAADSSAAAISAAVALVGSLAGGLHRPR
jgi:tryptophan synthase alpha chain